MNALLKTFTFFIITVLFFCCSPKSEETKRYLDATNSIKFELDQIDSTIYDTYMSTFLNLDHELYGDYTSKEFESFIKESKKTYDNLLYRIDTLESSVLFRNVQTSLRNLVVFQKEGLDTYYTKILSLSEIDKSIDDDYNMHFKKLEKKLFIAQIQLANEHGIEIVNSK